RYSRLLRQAAQPARPPTRAGVGHAVSRDRRRPPLRRQNAAHHGAAALMLAAENTLELDAAKRERTLVRIDAGAGNVSDINWLLFRGYHVLAKDYSTKRATHLAAQVTDWTPDPHDAARQMGRVPVTAEDYHAGQYQRAVTRVAVRCRLANGGWGIGSSSARCRPPMPSNWPALTLHWPLIRTPAP